MDLLANFKQLLYPREFRIASPVWIDELTAALREVAERQSDPAIPEVAIQQEAAIQEIDATAGPHLSIPGTDQDWEQENKRVWADLATGLWQLRQKMVEPGSERTAGEMRRYQRYLDFMWDALAGAGIEIQDHTGEAFVSGMVLGVLAFQPSSDLNHEQVLETIKPSVYLKNEMIQMGEVVVGTPQPLPVKQPVESTVETPRKMVG